MRTNSLLILALGAFLLLPSNLLAQRLQTLIDALGSSAQRPYARILFYEVDDQLCLFVGSQRGPGGLSAGQLRLMLLDGEGRIPLKFNFKGKFDGKDKDFLFWERCIPTPGEGRKDGELSIEIRQMKAQTRTTAVARQSYKSKMAYPAMGTAQGFDIHRGTTGLLQWAGRIQEAPKERIQSPS